MFTLPHNTIGRLYKQPVDMRLGMFRLQGLISSSSRHSFARGDFYLFTNRPRTLIKAVWFDGTGIYMFSKRLEKGQFSWPQPATPSGDPWMQVQPPAPALLLDGIELRNAMNRLEPPSRGAGSGPERGNREASRAALRQEIRAHGHRRP